MLPAVRLAVTQPLRTPVPADDAGYLRRKGQARLAFRTCRRMLQLAMSGQARWLREAFDPSWRRLLWIQDEAPQIGDALMDLAPRSLLQARGLTVDLLTAPHLVALFHDDRGWRQVASESSELAHDHDAVIASSHATRALARKRLDRPRLPWVSLAGYYSVPDYHRGLFTTRRLAELMGVELSPADLSWHARQKLDIEPAVAPPGAAAGGVAIAVGGVRADRTYVDWPAVVARLARGGVQTIRLLGSDNGRATADAIQAGAPPGLAVVDHVGRLDLPAVQAVMRQADAVLAADGGLMHLALTTQTPLLALFNAKVDPAWRLPQDFTGVWLRSDGSDVRCIPPERIAERALALLG